MRIAIALCLMCASALAADLPVDKPKAAPAARPAQGVFTAPSPTCVAWTDGCRTCTGNERGTSCSNVGISCTQGAVRCTREQPAR